MASAPPKSMANWLQRRSDHLRVLLNQVRLLSQITTAIRNALPEPLSIHCQATNVDDNTLVIGCDSSIWAAKLRYHLPQVLRLVKDHPDLPAFSQIRVRVQPFDKGITQPSHRRLFMPKHIGALITSVADCIVDPKLKAALRRLSQRATQD
jgi:hypothetical protein